MSCAVAGGAGDGAGPIAFIAAAFGAAILAVPMIPAGHLGGPVRPFAAMHAAMF